jgi:hypothetical protein
VQIHLFCLCRALSHISIGGYWNRKGFYELNVQVICDQHKLIIWRSINDAKGGENDSTAFKSTQLWEKLTTLACDPESFLNRNPFGLWFYILGDLIYALRLFLLTPYPTAASGSAEDAFNYFHSSNRIIIECCLERFMHVGVFSGNPSNMTLYHTSI